MCMVDMLKWPFMATGEVHQEKKIFLFNLINVKENKTLSIWCYYCCDHCCFSVTFNIVKRGRDQSALVEKMMQKYLENGDEEVPRWLTENNKPNPEHLDPEHLVQSVNRPTDASAELVLGSPMDPTGFSCLLMRPVENVFLLVKTYDTTINRVLCGSLVDKMSVTAKDE